VPTESAGARKLREDEELRVRSGRPDLRLVEPDLARGESGQRRTVTITGNPVPARRRPSPAQAQLTARPDRIALWAFVLGLFLVVVAAATAHAAVL
jgi:hypothetical protein